jgi:hypothetical protein
MPSTEALEFQMARIGASEPNAPTTDFLILDTGVPADLIVGQRRVRRRTGNTQVCGLILARRTVDSAN